MNEITDPRAAVAIEALEAVAQAFRDAAATYLETDDVLRAAICHSAHQRLRKEAVELTAHLL
jgi:hypothetical protein